MNATKAIAFLLGLVSLAGVLFFAAISVAGPFLLGEMVSAPPPLDGASPGCLALLMLAVSLPLAAIPGLAGLGLWFFVIRKQEAASEREAAMVEERERAFQIRLDGLTRRLLDCGGEAAAIAPEIPVWTRDLDESQRSRLLEFLAESGAWAAESLGSRRNAGEARRETSGCARALAVGLFVFAGFCFLWGILTLFTHLGTHVEIIQGVRPGPESAVVGSLGCFLPGLAGLSGGFILRWLLRRDKSRNKQQETSLDHAREAILESCLGRIRLLHPGDRRTSPLEAVSGRIARADVLCSLRELDGTGKGRLITRLHNGGLLAGFSLENADLRGAVFADADLSGATLSGADLSGAVLAGARLFRADLCDSRLQGADLRAADAGGAALRQADLKQARLHRCSLRQADLRDADLKGANLWQADLTGAELKGARITVEQLLATLDGAALLPGDVTGARP